MNLTIKIEILLLFLVGLYAKATTASYCRVASTCQEMSSATPNSINQASFGHKRLQASELVYDGELRVEDCPTDNNGVPCAHIIVESPLQNLDVDGDMILKRDLGLLQVAPGTISFWVSTSGNTTKKTITIAHSGYYSTVFNLSCQGNKLMPQCEYRIAVKAPSASGTVIFSSKSVNYYTVFIDGDLFEANGNGLISINLPAGTYSFTAQAKDKSEETGSIDVVADSIIEKQIDLLPQNRLSKEYIEHRISQMFDDKSNRKNYLTPSFRDLYIECSNIISKAPSLMEYSDYIDFISGRTNQKQKMVIEKIYFPSKNKAQAVAEIRLDFPNKHYWTLFIDYVNENWFIDDIKNRDPIMYLWDKFQSQQLTAARSAFKAVIVDYNRQNEAKSKVNTPLEQVVELILSELTGQSYFERMDIEHALAVLSFLKGPFGHNGYYNTDFWTYKCNLSFNDDDYNIINYENESIVIECCEYYNPAVCSIMFLDYSAIKRIENQLIRHKWVKRNGEWKTNNSDIVISTGTSYRSYTNNRKKTYYLGISNH